MILNIFKSGINSLLDYLSGHVLLSIVPAFFIAGAMTVFVSPTSILRYFGPKAKKWISYTVASCSGILLAVCSCTILPLFGSIYKKGAGLGPAMAFLYSGPALNILAVIYSIRLLGWQLGLARLIGSIVFSIVIGLLMALLFRKEEAVKSNNFFLPEAAGKGDEIKKLVFFILLIGILLSGTTRNWVIAAIVLVVLIVVLKIWFKKDEIIIWLKSTLMFVRMIVPYLILGIFIAGMIKAIVPPLVISSYVGGNKLSSNFIASFLGTIMYFCTLAEVPIVRALRESGMGKGPALALLLSGPALSLPSILVLRKILGAKKTVAYLALVVMMATIAGFIFGVIVR